MQKRPTLDKFIAGDNIILTPDIDKTTLKISSKIAGDASAYAEKIKDLTEALANTDGFLNTLDVKAGKNITVDKDGPYPNDPSLGTVFTISAKNAGMTEEERQQLVDATNIAENVQSRLNDIATTIGDTVNADYLKTKIKAGENITITPNEDNASLTINAKTVDINSTNIMHIKSSNDTLTVLRDANKNNYDLLVDADSLIKEERFEVTRDYLSQHIMRSFDVKSKNVISVFPVIELLNNTFPNQHYNNFTFYTVEHDDGYTTIVWNDNIKLHDVKKYTINVRYY